MTPNTPKCATIHDLLNELIILIFEHLSIGHLIQCSLVCKRFKLLCLHVKIPELIISETPVDFKDNWFFTNKQLYYRNSISVTTFNSYRSTFTLEKFRRLYFDGNATEYAQLKLNEFTRLEQVAINLFYPDPDDVRHEFHINLPHLKILEIYSVLNNQKFVITTPQLESLKYDEFDSIEMTQIDCIKHLETGFVTESNHVVNRDEIPLIEHIRDAKLTTLSCNRATDYVLEAIKMLIQDKHKHGRSLPTIYFLSVEVDDVKKIDEYKTHRDDFLFQINNYNSLAETVSQDTLLNYGINYNQLMNAMNGKIPEDFFKKFSSTRKVCVDKKVENPEHLSWFLKNFDYLQELNLRSDPLDQSFYSQLGDLDQLFMLTVEDRSVPLLESSKLNFNFDFLLKLNLLREFNTNFTVPNTFDLTFELFRQLTNFQRIEFFFKEKEMLIYKDRASNVYYSLYAGCEKLKIDFDELVRELSAIRGQYNDQD